jgi:hypothetical protein
MRQMALEVGQTNRAAQLRAAIKNQNVYFWSGRRESNPCL